MISTSGSSPSIIGIDDRGWCCCGGGGRSPLETASIIMSRTPSFPLVLVSRINAWLLSSIERHCIFNKNRKFYSLQMRSILVFDNWGFCKMCYFEQAYAKSNTIRTCTRLQKSNTIRTYFGSKPKFSIKSDEGGVVPKSRGFGSHT